ncbi:MAG TPA: hypothetical protein VKG63_02555 [Steroidobacteraceae bacterium]|nr:hypothetical protein [Steroidobacteraceae bacterium]
MNNRTEQIKRVGDSLLNWSKLAIVALALLAISLVASTWLEGP